MTGAQRASACVVAALVGTLLLAEQARAGDSVQLRFAWPDNLSGTVSYIHRLTSHQSNALRSTLEVRGSSRFSVSPAAGDLVVDFHESSARVVEGPSPGPDGERGQNVLLTMAVQRPDYRVSRDGTFQGLSKPAEQIRSLQASATAGAAGLPPDLQAQFAMQLERTLSRDRVSAVAREYWTDEVGRWVDKKVDNGSPPIMYEMIDLPIPADGPVSARVTYRLLGGAPCGSGPEHCVELEFRAVDHGPDAKAAFIQTLRRRNDQMREMLTVGAYSFETTTVLIAHPETLIPYRRRTEWVQTADLQIAGRTIATRQSGSYEIVYAYD